MEKTFENWLVVSDIDGTLNNKIRKLPKRNYDAIKKFTDLGGNFTLASGRLQSSLERNYNRITPNQPAVVLNGAGLYDYKEKKMLWRSTIGEKGRDFVKLVEKEYNKLFKSVDIGIYFDDYVYIVKNGLFASATMYFDKAHFEVVKSIDDVPKDGWMKVIFCPIQLQLSRFKNLLKKTKTPTLTLCPHLFARLKCFKKALIRVLAL